MVYKVHLHSAASSIIKMLWIVINRLQYCNLLDKIFSHCIEFAEMVLE